MNIVLRYADPAGNITAIVESPVQPCDRVALSRKILALGSAEQVGFTAEPNMGGAGRLEMMGGEFCGNAARSFGYLLARERYSTGIHRLPVEISGASAPVPVTVNLDRNLAMAQMPLPLGLEQVSVRGHPFPVVFCEGICHLIARNQIPDRSFVDAALDAMASLNAAACGVMFLEGGRLTPAVYVASTDSLVWESSCGSGSTACGWYLAGGAPDGLHHRRFFEPGGCIEVAVTVNQGSVSRIAMGGRISISAPVSLAL